MMAIQVSTGFFNEISGLDFFVVIWKIEKE
jgi:hypothetical protein